ncbi:arsenate reductase family protein [Actibacterium sp.]|uniref:arsenate reductase family protein n=1 Tax=Actibacterium sp. TaxID=1872125 RepID=UPI003561FDC2
MRLYGLKTCDTCRKSLKILTQAGHNATLIDIRQQPLTPEQLAQFHAVFGDDLVNRRSTTWRGLPASERDLDPLELLARHPALMKRPVIEAAGQLYLGWDKQVQAALLG